MTGLLAGSLPSPSLRTPPTAWQEQAGAHVRPERNSRPHVIEEELFRGALLRECKRADRFDQPFMLLVVAGKDGSSVARPIWWAAIEVLSSITRDTDLLGWLDKYSALGVIVPEIGTDPAVRIEIETKVRRELARRLSPEAAAALSIRLHVHGGATSDPIATAEALTAGLGRTARTSIRDAVKRVLDVSGSVALLLLLLPTFLVIALLVKLTSRGPVFYGQERIGGRGKRFRMLKFRTMYVNADHAIHEAYVRQFINGSDPALQAANNGVFKIVNDPRVTPIGRFLRKTSLDELPQFWNVATGEMSLVGPRPPLPYEVAQYKPWHYRRVLEAKPGITGLWQVTGRSRTTFDDMVRLDLRYAKTHSVWTDVKILLATPRAVFSGKGAC
jgi:lipopolysaccharide/colanic/teichoic acid biosynthesis glycosyltransferase